MISVDPPYRIADHEMTKVFGGWCTVGDESAPKISVSVDGADVLFETGDFPEAKAYVAGRPVLWLKAAVDFERFFASHELIHSKDDFLLDVCVTTEGQSRNFEFAVSGAWLDAVMPGAGVRPKPMPPEHLQIRVAGAAAGGFYASAWKTAAQIESILATRDVKLQECDRILDFGCGCGRLIGAIGKLHPLVTLSGSDIDAEAIAWCRDNLGAAATFDANGAAPPTRYAADSFDLIYSISLYTHLPEEMQFAWLAEMRRILKPGGFLLTTILNPATYVLPGDVARAVEASGFVYHEAAPETSGLPGFYRLAYHTHEYVTRAWSPYFEILRIGQSDLNDTQDSVLCRKPS